VGQDNRKLLGEVCLRDTFDVFGAYSQLDGLALGIFEGNRARIQRLFALQKPFAFGALPQHLDQLCLRELHHLGQSGALHDFDSSVDDVLGQTATDDLALVAHFDSLRQTQNL